MHPILTHRTPHQPFAAAPNAAIAPAAPRASAATPPPPAAPTLSIRIDDANPDHHLWRNHGWWWIHYVVHRGNRKERIRRSLQTRDVAVARRRRDECFARLRTVAAAGTAVAAASHAPTATAAPSAPTVPAADPARAPNAA
jgi:hypothetical protein